MSPSISASRSGISPLISGCVIARDNAETLSRCLDSIRWVDEIVILVDPRSRDHTEKIARERAHHFEVHPYEGDVEQKRTCVSRARHDWVLVIDPDEVMGAEAESEVRARIGAGGDDGFEINRVTFHLGRWIHHGDFYPDWKLRVFRRERARWVGRNPHGRIEIDGRVGRLRVEIEHFSYRDLAEQVERIQFFSDESARALDVEGVRVRLRDLVLRPPARFLRAYLLKAGWRDGVPGFIIAAATAFHVFLKYAKLWERQRLGLT